MVRSVTVVGLKKNFFIYENTHNNLGFFLSFFVHYSHNVFFWESFDEISVSFSVYFPSVSCLLGAGLNLR